jgi:hypothetical protein
MFGFLLNFFKFSTDENQMRDKRREEDERKYADGCDLLSGFDEGVGRHDHEDAIGEDGQNDEEGEERMNEDVDGHPPDGIERRQEPHGVRRAEPENIFAFADHHERLPTPNQTPQHHHHHNNNNPKKSKKRHDHTLGG